MYLILQLLFAWVSLVVAYRQMGVFKLKNTRTLAHMLNSNRPDINAEIDTNPISLGEKRVNVGDLTKIGVVAANAFLISSLGVAPDSAGAVDGSDPIVVLGSRGKTGKLIVEQLASKGAKVIPALRDTSKADEFKSLGVQLPVAADVTKIDTLSAAISGASVVVFAASASSKGGNAKDVDYIGVENVAKECVRLGVSRLVVISSGAVTKPNSLGFKITNLFGGIMGYKLQGENSVRSIYAASNNDKLGYAIIRPGGLLDGAAVGAGGVELNQGDTISGEINRADVAECAVAATLSTSIPNRVTFEVYQAGKSGPLQSEFPAVSGFERSGVKLGADYEFLLKGLQKDT